MATSLKVQPAAVENHEEHIIKKCTVQTSKALGYNSESVWSANSLFRESFTQTKDYFQEFVTCDIPLLSKYITACDELFNQSFSHLISKNDKSSIDGLGFSVDGASFIPLSSSSAQCLQCFSESVQHFPKIISGCDTDIFILLFSVGSSIYAGSGKVEVKHQYVQTETVETKDFQVQTEVRAPEQASAPSFLSPTIKENYLTAEETQAEEMEVEVELSTAGSDKVEVKYQIKDKQTWAENVEIKKTKAQEQAHIRGTEVIAQKTFTLTQDEVDLNFEGYGFKLHVPENSLPAEVSEAQLNVRVSLSGPFQMPFSSELLSAVYWISSSHKFEKPITVKIQHCAVLSSDKQCSKLTFVRTNCTQKELPYKFKELAGGVFEPKNSYGSISLSHFSGVAIAVRGQQQEKERVVEQYCAQLYSAHKLVNEWKLDFVVTKDLDPCRTVLKKEYSSQQQFSFTFCFESDFVSLAIPKEGLQLDGWKVTPFYNPQITRKQVNNFSSGKSIPKCELLLEWDQKTPPTPFHHSVGLLGAGDMKYILLHINPASYTRSRISFPPLWILFLLLAVVSGIAGLWLFGPTLSQMYDSLSPIGSSTISPSTDCHQITRKQDLYTELAEIGNWQSLCTNLEVPEATINNLENERLKNNAKKQDCLSVYFNQGKACWEKVIQVIAGDPFYNEKLASQIAKKYGVNRQE